MTDERVPVTVRSNAAGLGADDILVAASPSAGGQHPFACACCQPRSALGRELGRLFSARARGDVAFFRRVVVVAAGDGARAWVGALIAADAVAAARFRLDPD